MKHTRLSPAIAAKLKRISAAATIGALLFPLGTPVAFSASSWNPTLLVNTEAFQTIDEGDGATNVEMRFGQSLGEKLIFDRTQGRFEFTDDLSVAGTLSGSALTVDGQTSLYGGLTVSGATVLKSNVKVRANLSGTTLNVDQNASIFGALTTSGAIATKSNLTINQDADSNNAILTFGSDASNETITWANTADRFEFSDDVRVLGNLSTSGNLSGASLDVNGTATINGALTASGTIATKSNLTINQDADSNNAILTFGSDTTNETITWANTADRFEFSDDIRTAGSISGALLDINGNINAGGVISASGAIKTNSFLSGSTLTVDGNTTLRGQTYAFPTSQGNGFLKNDGGGTLTWQASAAVGNGSGDVLDFQPEYPNAVYFGSGTTAYTCVGHVGTLGYDYDQTNNENLYRWQTTRTTNNCYWVSLRVRVPKNFNSWDPHAPITFKYRSSGGYLDFFLKDTAGANVTLTGNSNLRNANWTTATITRSGGTYTADGFMTAFVRATASGSATLDRFADAGALKFNWSTTTP